jgi:hypothetical protein
MPRRGAMRVPTERVVLRVEIAWKFSGRRSFHVAAVRLEPRRSGRFSTRRCVWEVLPRTIRCDGFLFARRHSPYD